MSSNIPAKELRPLPPRPDLEFEHARAAELVTQGNGEISLVEAQQRVAQSYGFATWEKLVRYFTTWALHARARKPRRTEMASAADSVRQLQTEFANRAAMPVQPPDIIGTGAAFSMYVPRFYGLSDTEIFASTLSESDAQLVTARRAGFNSWTELKEVAAAHVPRPRPTPAQLEEMRKIPRPYSFESFTQGETDRERITNLFTVDRRMFKAVTENDMGDWSTWQFVILAIAALQDRIDVMNWLRSLGVDLQAPLNLMLLGSPVPMKTGRDLTRAALELGADPHWIPRSGFSVLEHALARHGSGESVDLIAANVTPRTSFWVAAGLGDVATMNSFFEPSGELSRAAHDDRPDFDALGSLQLGGIGRPDAPEVHVMWEAFIVAVMNGRLNTVSALLDQGYPPDYAPVWMNALHICVNYDYVAVAELLLSRGANPDFKAWPDRQSPREMAAWWVEQESTPKSAARLILSHGIR